MSVMFIECHYKTYVNIEYPTVIALVGTTDSTSQTHPLGVFHFLLPLRAFWGHNFWTCEFFKKKRQKMFFGSNIYIYIYIILSNVSFEWIHALETPIY